MPAAQMFNDDGTSESPHQAPLSHSQRTSRDGSGGAASRPATVLTLGGISVGGSGEGVHDRVPSRADSNNNSGVLGTATTTVAKGTPTVSSGASGSTELKKHHVVDRASEFGDVVLRLKDIEKTYLIEGSQEPVTALRGIHLTESNSGGFLPIKQGEFVMIRGPSGGGKTTLLNIIGTLDAPTKGSVELLGSVVNSDSSDEELADLRLKHLGFVFQTFNLIATMTAAENVELPMTLANTLSEKERRLRARQLLALVGLRNRIDHLPSELSGGEQQRVTIARSLANNPSVLLLDEPTGDLDTATTIDVMNLLVKMNRATRTTCIMVTHNPDLECYADRILYVSDGSFAREVINVEPRILSLDDYVKHLNDREAHMTTEVVRREA